MAKKKDLYRFSVNIDGLIFVTDAVKLTQQEATDILFRIHTAQGRNQERSAEMERKDTIWSVI